MKHLQLRYNLLQIFYWLTSCTIYGYTAVFLQYKGLNNTQIGIVTGLGAFLSIFSSPYISSLVTRIKMLTIRKLMLVTYIIMFCIWIIMIVVPLPSYVLIGLFILIINMIVSNVPLLSMICMDYLKSGHYLNFGLARGAGSVSYAVSAVLLGQFIDLLNPSVLAIAHAIGAIFLFTDLFTMPDISISSAKDNQKDSISMYHFILKYKRFFMILLAFGFLFGASSTLATFLVNIVKKLGGNTSVYGIAIFCMAASEMPFMAIAHSLMKRIRTESILLFASLMYIFRNFLICFAPSLSVLLIGLAFQGISYGLFTAAITYYVNEAVEEKDTMMGQTMIGVLTTGMGATIGNFLGGYLQDCFGLSVMLAFALVLTVIGVLLMIIIIAVKRQKDTAF